MNWGFQLLVVMHDVDQESMSLSLGRCAHLPVQASDEIGIPFNDPGQTRADKMRASNVGYY